MKPARLLAILVGALVAAAAGAASAQEGKATYDRQCAVCHASGLAGAPRRGNAGDWAQRLKPGKPALYQSAIRGTPRGMPARGGDPGLSDQAVRAAVDYLLAGAIAAAPAAAPEKATARSAPADAPKPVGIAASAAAPAPASAPAAKTAAPAVVAVAVRLPEPGSGAAESNAFNRLLKPVGKRNLPPAEDGIHDASVDGTLLLQAPLASFDPLPRSNAGNRVDWVKSLEQGKIAPRWERDKPEAAATVMDLNIVREVKGSMPDVVYPHKQHTEWLDCANCHPGIFVPQKGANQMSMAAILLGKGCGTCHGKVAFPVSECRLCHSRKKDDSKAPVQAASSAEKR